MTIKKVTGTVLWMFETAIVVKPMAMASVTEMVTMEVACAYASTHSSVGRSDRLSSYSDTGEMESLSMDASTCRYWARSRVEPAQWHKIFQEKRNNMPSLSGPSHPIAHPSVSCCSIAS